MAKYASNTYFFLIKFVYALSVNIHLNTIQIYHPIFKIFIATYAMFIGNLEFQGW